MQLIFFHTLDCLKLFVKLPCEREDTSSVFFVFFLSLKLSFKAVIRDILLIYFSQYFCWADRTWIWRFDLKFVIIKNKLKSVIHASVGLLTMNFINTVCRSSLWILSAIHSYFDNGMMKFRLFCCHWLFISD